MEHSAGFSGRALRAGRVRRAAGVPRRHRRRGQDPAGGRREAGRARPGAARGGRHRRRPQDRFPPQRAAPAPLPLAAAAAAAAAAVPVRRRRPCVPGLPTAAV
ncbi:hypothetical protein DIPPA_21082, partial [Diplonema papillatum]